MKEKVVFCWSGGKDSALALNRVLRDNRYQVVSLLTTCSEHFQRVSMHGVRLELLDQQAASIGKSVSQPAHAADGEKVIHHVDISWNQSWTGTDLVRFYKLDGNTLTITTARAQSVIDGEEGQFILVWEKVTVEKAEYLK